MCRNATTWIGRIVFTTTVLAVTAAGQQIQLDWRRIGNSAVELALPSAGTGAVNRVWYASDGSGVYAQTPNGAIWHSADFEKWKPADLGIAPARGLSANVGRVPEANAYVQRANGTAVRWYAAGRFVYRSDDGNAWSNTTAYQEQSILGSGILDMAVSPGDPDDLVVANGHGVWRSLDGGLTWNGLNQGLPALQPRKILALPNGLRPARLLIDSGNGAAEVDWQPGERSVWRPAERETYETQRQWRSQLSRQLGAQITAASAQGDWVYAGSSDGRLWASSDRAQNWQTFTIQDGGSVNDIYVNPSEPRIALAAMSIRNLENRTPLVVHTVNGGRFWDDTTANMPAGAARAIAADPETGAIYAATSAGVYFTITNLSLLATPTPWIPVSLGLPSQSVMDLRLDEAGNQLFVALDGWGLYAAMAPHRSLRLNVVNAADWSTRPAAPGSLLSILGARADRVAAGNLRAPVLGVTAAETQIQVPFEATGELLSLTLEAAGGTRTYGLPLAAVSPAVFIARDGAPLLLDAHSGVALDASNPAHPGGRVQILATGMGAVEPEWPTGIPAPAENTPKVATPIKVYLDKEPVEVTRATLAPGYIGFYLIEIQLPKLVNAGPAELFLEAGGRQSNRVRLYLAP